MLLREQRCLACSMPFMPVKAHLADTEPERDNLQQNSSSACFFCTNCLEFLQKRLGGYCPYCGELAKDPNLPLAPCGECLKAMPPWESCFFFGKYKDLLRDLILRYKFKEDIFLCKGLSSLLWQSLQGNTTQIDAIIPIPLHRKRLHERGYNQALEISKNLQKLFIQQNILAGGSDKSLLNPMSKKDIPILCGALVRKVNSKPQVGLSRQERIANTKNIFQVKNNITGKNILLVDDIYTTGATFRSASEALLEAGAKSVHLAFIARA